MKMPDFSRLRGKIAHITGDFIINILASVVYTFARQIVVFPLFARRMTEADYGTLLTVVGLATICTTLVGNSLNNIRLIQNSRYEERQAAGDFNLLCLIGAACSVLFSLVMWWMFRYSWLTALLLTAYLLVSELYQYASAFFRLELNFKRIFAAYAVASAAYMLAALVIPAGELWPAVFLVGEGAALVYVAWVTRFYREPLARTPLFGETSRKLVILMLSGLVGNVLLYADRMIIYPTLGAESVSYYSVASFFGKSAGIVMTPISGVLLGYFAQKSFAASKKLFTLVNALSVGCLGLFAVACYLLAPWFTRLLYPTLFAQAAPYIMLANWGAILSIAGNMAQPMILKSCSTKWILLVQVLYGAVYLLTASLLMPSHGLTGFCWAAILACGVRLLALYGIGYWKL